MRQFAIYTKSSSGAITFKGVEYWASPETMLEACCRNDEPSEPVEMLGWPDTTVIWHGDVGYAERRAATPEKLNRLKESLSATNLTHLCGVHKVTIYANSKQINRVKKILSTHDVGYTLDNHSTFIVQVP